MDEKQRWLVFVSVCFTVILIWTTFFAPPPPPPTTATGAGQVATAPSVPGGKPTVMTEAGQTSATLRTGAAATPPPAEEKPLEARAKAPHVALVTTKFQIQFSRMGAVPIRWDLIDPRFVPQPDPRDYVTGAKIPPRREELITPDLAENAGLPAPFETVLLNYKEFNTAVYEAKRIDRDGMTGWQFTSPATDDGLRMVKTYLVDPKNFTGRLEIELRNEGKYNFTGAGDDQGHGLGLALGPGLGFDPDDALLRKNSATYGIGPGQGVSAVTKREADFVYKYVDAKSTAPVMTDGGQIDWSGLLAKYFIAVVIPRQGTQIAATRVRLDSRLAGTVTANERLLPHFPTLEVFSPAVKLAPGETHVYAYDLFIGPKERGVLKEAGHGLDRVLFFDSWGWVRAVCFVMMSLLSIVHAVVGNWGVAILLMTALVRILLFPLVQKGLREQAKMAQSTAKLKPLIDKVNQKYKNDPQRKQQEVMQIYKDHGVNPFGMFKGCLWMMIQLPIFIALYRLLYQSVDLRGAHFLWVTDLSQPDRLFTFAALPIIGSSFNLLPFIVGATQMLSSKLSMQPSTDPQQQQMQTMMIYVMPFMILYMTYTFPAGLMLYWLVSNAWQIVQQQWVNKHIRKPAAAAAAAAANNEQ